MSAQNPDCSRRSLAAQQLQLAHDAMGVARDLLVGDDVPYAEWAAVSAARHRVAAIMEGLRREIVVAEAVECGAGD